MSQDFRSWDEFARDALAVEAMTPRKPIPQPLSEHDAYELAASVRPCSCASASGAFPAHDCGAMTCYGRS